MTVVMIRGFLESCSIYFAYSADHEGLTTLATEDGVEISRHMVLLISNLSARVETALKAVAVPGANEG